MLARFHPRTILLLGLGAVVLLGIGLDLWLKARAPAAEVAPLSSSDDALYDRLVEEASDHVERGVVLLELGLRDEALSEFAAALLTFEASPLRSSPWVAPQLAQLEATIHALYEGRADGVAGPGLRSRLRAVLAPEEFAAAVQRVFERFQRRYGRGFDITGADHLEHRTLYGPGGALDIRTRDLDPYQVQFLIAEFQREGLRVKDFSTDAVLQAQIVAAVSAGLPERAGTGLHLHVDRFADRWDRWTR